MVTQPDIHAGPRKRILVISDAGEGARPGGARSESRPAWTLAEALSLDHDVILAVPGITKDSHPRFAVVYYNRRNIGLLASDSDLVIFGPPVLKENPFLEKVGFLAAASRQAIKKGDFEGISRLQEAGALEGLSSGELLVLRPVPVKVKNPGPSYFLARLRGYLRRVVPKSSE